MNPFISPAMGQIVPLAFFFTMMALALNTEVDMPLNKGPKQTKIIYLSSNISSTESDVNIRISKAWIDCY